MIISAIEIIGYFILKDNPDAEEIKFNNSNQQNLNVNINVGPEPNRPGLEETQHERKIDRSAIIDMMLLKTGILFIDDDEKFNVVKILKDSGWRKTKTVIDVKNLDVMPIKEADIIFVDINGVGRLLNLQHEGLDLALMLKQKYPMKKVIIYSANRTSNSFHEAWDYCDFKLEKNALPYQFQNLVEEYSIEIYNQKK